ncbi:MAG: 16S rRNA (cytosine(967)-C(5))-methyltransferase RsmB [Gammaproteobacteria bacterium]|nr:16S rRNA (cytosine(967)-C(5))-methyltransferase RsmB [Gammaproteobacteria bacterium]
MASPKQNPRATAARILSQVIRDGRSLSRAIEDIPSALSDDRALIQEMCYGVLREYHRLSVIVASLLKKPLKEKDADVQALLLLGLYQLMCMRVPDHAAVSETVAATATLKKVWARGMVNGVLRNFQRQQEKLLVQVDITEEGRWSHPQWLINALREAWPTDWQTILAANNQRPPMCLRINTAKISADDYLQLLEKNDIAASRGEFTTSAIRLEHPQDVTALPGFVEGWLSVQDEAAQQAAGLMGLEPGQRVLDVCAAPGGKTVHMLELAEVEMIAVDVDAARLQRVKENLQRVGKTARCVVGDACMPNKWWDGQPFDRILLDAPCSATGVIRRHPDIKLLRRESDIKKLVTLQAQILDAIWPLLKPGGMLVYATCSVLPEENARQITAFVDRQVDAQLRTINVQWGVPVMAGQQVLPGNSGMDGFYYACLEKTA